MIAYFDTSAVIPLILDEPGSARATLLWDAADRVATSRLLYAEARAALAMASRLGRLAGPALRRAVERLDDLLAQVDLVEVTGGIVRRAGALAEELSLRGYDAVHLASAETLGDLEVVVVAGDRALLKGAAALGLAVGDLESAERLGVEDGVPVVRVPPSAPPITDAAVRSALEDG